MGDVEVGQMSLADAGIDLSESTPDSSHAAEATERIDEEAASSARDEAAIPDEPQDEKEEEEKDPLQALIDTKYGGDKGKFVKGLHEQWKSTASLKRELDELKSKLATPEVEQAIQLPELPPPDELNNEIKWLDDEITSIAAQAKSFEARRDAILTEADGHQRTIAKLEGKLELADEFQQDKIKAEIKETKRDLRNLSSEYQSLGQQIQNSTRERRGYEQRKAAMERELQGYQAKQQQWKEEQLSTQRQIRQQFDETFDKLYAQYSFPDPDGDEEAEKYKSDLNETIRAEIAFRISTLPENAPLVDVVEEAKVRLAKHAKMRGITAKQAIKQLSKEKASATTNVAPKGTALPAKSEASSSSSAKNKWTPEFVRERARRILGS